MKSILIALAVMTAGLSTGCAQIEYLQNPANYRVNELTGQRMYCHGDQRDNYTPCQGWQSPAQIAQKAEQAKIAEANARIEAEKQAMDYGTTKEREALVYASLNRVRTAEGDELLDNSGGHAISDEERDLINWVETPNFTIAEMKNTLRVREIKLIAAAKKKAQIAAKEAAYAASPAGKLKAKREAAAQAKRDAEALNAIFGKNGLFGAAIENYNNMTPEQRARFHEKNEERKYQEKLIRDQNNYIANQNRMRQNLLEHRR